MKKLLQKKENTIMNIEKKIIGDRLSIGVLIRNIDGNMKKRIVNISAQ